MTTTVARRGRRALVGLAVTALLAPAGPAHAATATSSVVTAAQAPTLTVSRTVLPVRSTVDVTVTGTPGESVALLWSGPFIPDERMVHSAVLDASGRFTFVTRPPDAGTTTFTALVAGQRSNAVAVQVLPSQRPVAVVAPTEVDLGTWVAVEVTGTPGELVDLLAYTRPSTQYRVVRSGTLDASGRAVFAIRPGGDTRLLAQVRHGLVGPSDVVGVRYAVSFAAEPQPDGSYRFVGTVVPRRAGVPVAVYRGLPDGSRQLVGRGTTTATGQYSVPAWFADAGTSFFVATAGGTAANRQGTSRAVAVAVQP